MKFYALVLLILATAVFFSYLSPSTVGEATRDTNHGTEYQPDLTEEDILRALLSNVDEKERDRMLQKVEDAKRKGPQLVLDEKVDELREHYLK